MTTTDRRPPWWPTAKEKQHADAGCAHEWRDGRIAGCKIDPDAAEEEN